MSKLVRSQHGVPTCSSADYHVDRFYVSRHNTERDEGFGRLESESCGKYGLLAQSVEHMTVNHGVAGSKPAGAAKWSSRRIGRVVTLSRQNLGVQTSPRSPSYAVVAQLVEHKSSKLGVAGSCPVYRSSGSDGLCPQL